MSGWTSFRDSVSDAATGAAAGLGVGSLTGIPGLETVGGVLGGLTGGGGGGGGPSAPTPNPGIDQAAAANLALGRESLDFWKGVYADNKTRQAGIDDLSKQVTQQQMDIANKQQAQSDDYINYMKTTFRPIEQKLADEATNFNTDQKREELAGRASADVEQAAAASDAAARRDAARYGINPSDAAFSDMLAGSAYNKSMAKVGAANQARTAARAEGRALSFDVAGLGRGLPSAGTNASSVALQAGNSALNNAVVPTTVANQNAAAMQTGYNAGMTGASNSGNLLLGQFGAQAGIYGNELQANAIEQAGMYGAIGSALGAGAGLAARSSKKAKTDKKPVSEKRVLEAVKGLPTMESWRYKKGEGDGGKHVGPYAEDVHKKFGDRAAPGGGHLDLISMNGINLAATKALAKQVDKLAKDVVSLKRSAAARGLERRAA